jgi:hypothetical protein
VLEPLEVAEMEPAEAAELVCTDAQLGQTRSEVEKAIRLIFQEF